MIKEMKVLFRVRVKGLIIKKIVSSFFSKFIVCFQGNVLCVFFFSHFVIVVLLALVLLFHIGDIVLLVWFYYFFHVGGVVFLHCYLGTFEPTFVVALLTLVLFFSHRCSSFLNISLVLPPFLPYAS